MPRSSLKELHPELLRVPVLSIPCSLRGIESITGDDATEFVENLCGDSVLQCTFHELLPHGSQAVDLVVGGKSVAEELCSSGLAKSGHFSSQSQKKGQPTVASRSVNHSPGMD